MVATCCLRVTCRPSPLLIGFWGNSVFPTCPIIGVRLKVTDPVRCSSVSLNLIPQPPMPFS